MTSPAGVRLRVVGDEQSPSRALRRPHEKMRVFSHRWNRTMDVEHINAIGNSLADLSKRTVDLRGYL